MLAKPLSCAVVLALAGGVASTFRWPVNVVGAVALGLGALLALRSVWRWDRTKLVVTTEKFSVMHGVLGRHAAAIRLEAVEAVELEQTLLGRFLGYGTLVAGPLEVSCVPAPREVCRLLEDLSA